MDPFWEWQYFPGESYTEKQSWSITGLILNISHSRYFIISYQLSVFLINVSVTVVDNVSLQKYIGPMMEGCQWNFGDQSCTVRSSPVPVYCGATLFSCLKPIVYYIQHCHQRFLLSSPVLIYLLSRNGPKRIKGAKPIGRIYCPPENMRMRCKRE